MSEEFRWGSLIPLVGGFSLGAFADVKSKPLFHISYEPFRANEAPLHDYWPGIPRFLVDDGRLPNQLSAILKNGKIDFLVATPPCSGLSMLNSCKKGKRARGATAEQNSWMYRSTNFALTYIGPQVLVGENAPLLFSEDVGLPVREKLREIGREKGYSFSLLLTNTNLHGIPQKRRRAFYFFWKSPYAPILNPRQVEPLPLSQFLDKIPKKASQQNESIVQGRVSDRYAPLNFILQHDKISYEDFVKNVKSTTTVFAHLQKRQLMVQCLVWMVQNYGRFPENSEERRQISSLEHAMLKLSKGLGYWDRSPKFFGKSVTGIISKNVSAAVHPTENRFLNRRELMHLMGFPSDFEVKSKTWNVICQTVPVTTAQSMIECVVQFIKGELPKTDFEFVKQNIINDSIERVTPRKLDKCQFNYETPFIDDQARKPRGRPVDVHICPFCSSIFATDHGTSSHWERCKVLLDQENGRHIYICKNCNGRYLKFKEISMHLRSCIDSSV